MKTLDTYLSLLLIAAGGTLVGCSTTGKTPSVVSATPASSNAPSQIFTVTARDADGFADINVVYFLINTTPSTPTNTCHGFYSRASNSLYLYDDATKIATGPLLPGNSGTLENSQCILYGKTSSLVSAPTGTDMTVNFGLGLKAGYSAAQQNVYFWVKDNENHDSGWVKTGTWF